MRTTSCSGKFTGPLDGLTKIGFSATDAKGKVIGVHEAMMRVANMMAGHDYKDAYQVLTGKLNFGAGVVPLLSKGGNEVQQSLMAMHQIGDVTEDAYRSSQKLNEEWVKLKASVGSAATELEHKFEPTLTRIVQSIEHMAEGAKDAVKDHPDAKPYAPRNNAAAHAKLPGWMEWLIHTPSNRNAKSGLIGPPAPAGLSASGSTMSPIAAILGAGWTSEQANGILANLMRESGLNPAAVGDNGQAYGIAQWHPDRQADFQKWAGKSIVGSSLSEQLAFMLFEMSPGGKEAAAGNKMRAAKTRTQVAELMSMLYERPADAMGEATKRARIAQGLPSSFDVPRSEFGTGIVNRLAPGGGSTTINNNTETHIGQINVHTKATDAHSMAKDVKAAVSTHGLVAQADSGMR